MTASRQWPRLICVAALILAAGLHAVAAETAPEPLRAGDTTLVARRAEEPHAVEPADVVPVVFTQVPAAAEARPDAPLPTGARIAQLDAGATTPRSLTPQFAAAADPVLSVDGQRLLFIGRAKPADHQSVWEMTADGAWPYEVVRQGSDITAATYLQTLYTIDSPVPLRRIAFTALDDAQRPALFTCRTDGSDIRQITFSPRAVRDPLLLSDGRLLLSMATDPPAPLRAGFRPTVLFTVFPDGAEMSAFAAVHDPPAVRSAPCEIDVNNEIVFVESDLDAAGHGGRLVAVPRTRSLKRQRTIADVRDGSYSDPAWLGENRLIVSYRGSDDPSWGLWEIDAATGRHIRKVYDNPDWHELNAAPVRDRPPPPGRSSVVDHTKRTGQLYGLDLYLSDTTVGQKLERGAIARLRILRAINAAGSASEAAVDPRRVDHAVTSVREITLGEVPVESDGSFFVEVPARVPLRMETLDTNGHVIQTMRSWIWVMPNEKRGCVGCHADPELTPRNRHVRALRKAPVHLPARIRRSPRAGENEEAAALSTHSRP